jgi:hypothetical protein
VAYSTTITLTSLEFAPALPTEAAIRATRGLAIEVLQWLIFGLSTLFCLGVARVLRGGGSGSLAAGGQPPAYNIPGLGAGGMGLPPPPPPPS